MVTTANAGGNAQASLFVTAAADPDETPFKSHLTENEIERHAYFNDDILELAVELDGLLARGDAVEDRQRPNLERQLEIAQADGNTTLASHLENMIADLPDRAGDLQRRVDQIEDRILAELDEVRTEYRALAETLNNGRTEYVEHYLSAEQLSSTTGVTREGARRYGLGPGPQSRMVYLDSQMASYERVHTDYKLIEQGFKHTTVRETLSNLVWGAIALIATEIATAGIAKFVAVGAAAIRLTAVGRAAVAAGTAGAALIGRFMALAERTRRRVVNVVKRGRRSDPPAHPTDGPSVTGRPSQAARPNCRAGACVLQ